MFFIYVFFFQKYIDIIFQADSIIKSCEIQVGSWDTTCQDVPCRSPKGPNVRYLQETFRGVSGDQYKNEKKKKKMKKLFFRSNSPCFTYLFQFFTGRTNIQMFSTGASTGRLREQVAGRHGNQMTGRSRDVHGMSVKHVF